MNNNFIECPRCSGKGRIDAYSHIKQGLCFLCIGKGEISLSTKLNKNFDFKKVTYKKGETKFRVKKNNGLTVWSKNYWEYLSIDWGKENIHLEINNANREQRRNAWQWFKANGFKMETTEYEYSVNEGMIFTEDGKIA